MIIPIQKVTKQYCFEREGVPAESEYLEVRYGVKDTNRFSFLSRTLLGTCGSFLIYFLI